MIDSILFDLDGVVLNSEPIKEKAHKNTVKLLNKNFPKDTYAHVLGGSSQHVFEYIQQVTGFEISYNEYNRLFMNIYNKLIEHCRFTPGFLNFFKKLKSHSYKFGIVTSCSEKMVSKIEVINKIIGEINCFVYADMVQEHKPSPMPYQKAISMLDKTPEQIIAFEDTTPGIHSAKSAGLKVIGIKHSLAHYQNYTGTISIWNNFSGNKYHSFMKIINHLQ